MIMIGGWWDSNINLARDNGRPPYTSLLRFKALTTHFIPGPYKWVDLAPFGSGGFFPIDNVVPVPGTNNEMYMVELEVRPHFKYSTVIQIDAYLDSEGLGDRPPYVWPYLLVVP
jgi:hypothetical protein